jgi:hypothetical protein
MTSQPAPWKAGSDAYHQMAEPIYDYWACWTISAIADLSIADHLAGRSLTAEEVAERAGSAPETTLRLLRAGVPVGLVTEEADGRFGSTPLLETLRSDDPRSLRPFVLSQISAWMPWDHLADGVRNGARSTKAFAQRRIDVPATLEPLPSSGRRNSSTQRRSEFHRGNFGQGIGQGHEVQALEMVENVVSDRREMTWPCLLQPC